MEAADLSHLYTATSLMQIDDNIMRYFKSFHKTLLTAFYVPMTILFKMYVSIRKFHGHNSLKEYYEKESCVHYIHNVSNILESQLY